jgi:hypothetical protein
MVYQNTSGFYPATTSEYVTCINWFNRTPVPIATSSTTNSTGSTTPVYLSQIIYFLGWSTSSGYISCQGIISNDTPNGISYLGYDLNSTLFNGYAAVQCINANYVSMANPNAEFAGATELQLNQLALVGFIYNVVSTLTLTCNLNGILIV